MFTSEIWTVICAHNWTPPFSWTLSLSVHVNQHGHLLADHYQEYRTGCWFIGSSRHLTAEELTLITMRVIICTVAATDLLGEIWTASEMLKEVFEQIFLETIESRIRKFVIGNFDIVTFLWTKSIFFNFIKEVVLPCGNMWTHTRIERGCLQWLLSTPGVFVGCHKHQVLLFVVNFRYCCQHLVSSLMLLRRVSSLSVSTTGVSVGFCWRRLCYQEKINCLLCFFENQWRWIVILPLIWNISLFCIALRRGNHCPINIAYKGSEY